MENETPKCDIHSEHDEALPFAIVDNLDTDPKLAKKLARNSRGCDMCPVAEICQSEVKLHTDNGKITGAAVKPGLNRLRKAGIGT